MTDHFPSTPRFCTKNLINIIKICVFFLSETFQTNLCQLIQHSVDTCGLIVSALFSRSSGPGLSPGWGHCIVFLGKKPYSHSASLHPGVQMGTGKMNYKPNVFLEVAVTNQGLDN